MQKHLFVILTFLFVSSVFASDIVVKLPTGTKVTNAEAKPLKMKLVTPGKVDGATVRFTNLLPDTAYDVKLTLSDGTVLQGVNMGWYDMEPANPDAGDITDDDKQQIVAVLKQVLAFSNKNDLILLNGNHDRATALVQLVRDKPFHSDSGDEVIWHMELWYYKNEHGGWEKVQQANEILRRERFPTHVEYQKTIEHLRWVAELGGLKVAKDGTDVNVTLPANAGILSSDAASTQPAN
jgi:hypothetical protein